MKVFRRFRFVIVTKFGDDHQLRRNHHQREKKREDQIFSRETQSCKGVGRQCDDHHHDGRRDHRENQCVQKIFCQRNGREGILIVFKSRRRGEKRRDMLRVISAVAFYRSQKHPVKRKQDDERPDRQKKIGYSFSEDPASFFRLLYFFIIHFSVLIWYSERVSG